MEMVVFLVEISNFQFPKPHTFKTRLRTKPLSCKSVLFA